jgi:1-acyl-sn-glycerol-3-phosphate acyltransferase
LVPRLRTTFVAVVLIGYLLVVGPPALLLAWIVGSPTLIFRLAVPAARFGLWASGVRIRVTGGERLDPSRNYLFMPNHISNVDPPVVVAALRRDTRMMGKASLFRIPVFGQVMSFAGFIPVERTERDSAIRAVDEAAARLRAGLDFVVFPEGTRSRDGKLLPLKKGPFFLAQKGGVPVVPVSVRGTREVMPKGGMLIRAGAVSVEIGSPIEVVDIEGDEAMVREELRRRVGAALVATGEARVPA